VRSTEGFISFTKCNYRELVLPGVGSLKTGELALPRVGALKTRELVLPRVGALKKGICVSYSWFSKKYWCPSLFSIYPYNSYYYIYIIDFTNNSIVVIKKI
jgi:hypothetical protein